ncbi:hypothetical protein D3C80_1856840 [compost metagenome]
MVTFLASPGVISVIVCPSSGASVGWGGWVGTGAGDEEQAERISRMKRKAAAILSVL